MATVFGESLDLVTVREVEDRVGTLIVAEQPIAFTSLTWRLIFEWDIDPLEETLKQLKFIHQNLTREVVDPTEEKAVLHVAEAMQTAEQEFNSFLDIIQGGKRGRRELKDPKQELGDLWRGTTGSLASTLFGVATSEEMDAVHGFLDTLFRRENKMVTIQKLHVTTLKKIQSQINLQQEQLDRMVNVTYHLYQVTMQKMKIRTDASVASLLVHNDLVNAITMFKMTVAGHKQVLSSLDRGYISPDLIPVKELQETLVQIRDKIPSGFKLIYDPMKDEMGPYYNLKLAKRLVGSRDLRGMIQIPLTGIIDDFMLYRSIPFPSQVGKNNPRRFMLKDSNRYIALSSDRRRFMDLDATFNQALCLQGKTLICPTSSAIITEPTANCLFHLISGNLQIGRENNKCELTEIKTEELYLQSIDVEEWAISTPTPIPLRPVCIDLKSSMTPTISHREIVVQGDVIVHIPRQCTVTIGHHVVPTRMLMSEDMGKVTSTLITPTLHAHQLLELHGLQLIADKLDEEINVVFKDMIEYHHSRSITINSTGREVQDLMKRMLKELHETEQIQPTIHYHTITWGALFFCVVAIIALGTWVKRRPKQKVVEKVRYMDKPPEGGPKITFWKKTTDQTGAGEGLVQEITG